MSFLLTMNTGTLQDCGFSPLFYFLYTHDNVARHSSNAIFKFASNNSTVGWILVKKSRGPRGILIIWSNGARTTILVSIFARPSADCWLQEVKAEDHEPVFITRMLVEKFLGPVHRCNHKLSSSTSLLPRTFEEIWHITNFERSTREHTHWLHMAWFNNLNAQEWKKLQKKVGIAWSITGTDRQTIKAIHTTCCLKMAANIINSSHQPD